MQPIDSNVIVQPIDSNKRRVTNINSGEYLALYDETGRQDGEVLQVNPGKQLGYGFHVYRMPAGHTTTAHIHDGDEEFLILEGEIVDHDGFRYEKGDLVWLEAKTKHKSYSPNGALLVVYFR